MRASLRADGRQPKLLLVDDSSTVRHLLSKHLRDAGFDVRLAENGEQALARLADERCDLILSDLRMPVMDGFEFLRRVRERDREQLFIALTGEEASWVKSHALTLGADDVVAKSAADNTLVEAITRHLRRA